MEYLETYKVYLNEEDLHKFARYMERYHKECEYDLEDGGYKIYFHETDFNRFFKRTERFIKYTNRKHIMCCGC